MDAGSDGGVEARASAGIGGMVAAFMGSMPGAEAIFDTGATITLPELAVADGAEAAEAASAGASGPASLLQPDRVATIARATRPGMRFVLFIVLR